jgi:hypothetical protein
VSGNSKWEGTIVVQRAARYFILASDAVKIAARTESYAKPFENRRLRCPAHRKIIYGLPTLVIKTLFDREKDDRTKVQEILMLSAAPQ